MLLHSEDTVSEVSFYAANCLPWQKNFGLAMPMIKISQFQVLTRNQGKFKLIIKY